MLRPNTPAPTITIFESFLGGVCDMVAIGFKSVSGSTSGCPREGRRKEERYQTYISTPLVATLMARYYRFISSGCCGQAVQTKLREMVLPTNHSRGCCAIASRPLSMQTARNSSPLHLTFTFITKANSECGFEETRDSHQELPVPQCHW